MLPPCSLLRRFWTLAWPRVGKARSRVACRVSLYWGRVSRCCVAGVPPWPRPTSGSLALPDFWAWSLYRDTCAALGFAKMLGGRWLLLQDHQWQCMMSLVLMGGRERHGAAGSLSLGFKRQASARLDVPSSAPLDSSVA